MVYLFVHKINSIRIFKLNIGNGGFYSLGTL